MNILRRGPIRSHEEMLTAALLLALDLAAKNSLAAQWTLQIGRQRQITPHDAEELAYRANECTHIGDILDRTKATQEMRRSVFHSLRSAGAQVTAEDFSTLTCVTPMTQAMHGSVAVLPATGAST
ncbi:hypothetical protein [Planctomyces sp. SH-PL14]|uniref:hypothetical protein n=1 Tax=Planctomyces sp. SH-PL14 TaxID=1632864 RepID=UPI00078D31BF|nr:hypothetical protein [Planctomyces sp. SH-PL14]AMV18234.1 hypothetical protein VT03_10120 [Planctomyces sp. SH-PL14]